MKLLPGKPAYVKYALTVPQSVLFADLSLRGNKREYFAKAMGIDYEPEYISIDNGTMSWNYENDKAFNEALMKQGSITDAIGRFVATMEKTGQELDKVSQNINGKDLTDKLRIFWRAYREHMTSLFTFWNVEKLLSDTLTSELRKVGKEDEIKNGLARFLKPDHPNYFVLERKELKQIAKKFNIQANSTIDNSTKGLAEALDKHRNDYGFLLAPFNLGEPPSLESILVRTKELSGQEDSEDSVYAQDSFSDLPLDIQELAKLAQKFTYQKTQRLDMFALADARAKLIYQQVAKTLSIKLDQVFAMTSNEILSSINNGALIMDLSAIEERQITYCLALINGKIDFYKPTKSNNVKKDESIDFIKGVGASMGIVRGKIRLVFDLKDAKEVEKDEIIVTTMTRPEMGAALDRASAFITDEGGLLCHAAIISREMKKPCIIATGNATAVFKTGDQVEVDANKGIVKIIK